MGFEIVVLELPRWAFAQANNPRSRPEIVSASSLKRKPSER